MNFEILALERSKIGPNSALETKGPLVPLAQQRNYALTMKSIFST